MACVCWLFAIGLLAARFLAARVPADARLAFKIAFEYACQKTELKHGVVARWLNVSDALISQWLTVDANQQQTTPNPAVLWKLKEISDPAARRWLAYFWPAYQREMGQFAYGAEEIGDLRDQMLAIANQVQAAVRGPRVVKAELQKKGAVA